MPKWLSSKSILWFAICIIVCSLTYSNFRMEVRLAAICVLSVILFFVVGSSLLKKWKRVSERRFITNLFIAGLIIRILWVSYAYVLNIEYYDVAMGDKADCEGYIDEGLACAEEVLRGNYNIFGYLMGDTWMCALDDTGYPIWLMIIYLLTGSFSDVYIPFLVKSAISAYCAISIYHIANRHYGEWVARLAAMFTMLNPNMIYWCGTMFKESELVFLCCLFVDKMDSVLSQKTITFKNILPAALIGMALFLYRGALGLIAFAATFLHVILSSTKVIGWEKKLIVGFVTACALLIGMGDNLMTQTERVVNSIKNDEQKGNMEWRANRTSDGAAKQSFARYASATVFAPLIFTIPFPSFNVADSRQLRQQILSGGSYIKNILSYFVILVMFLMLFSGAWKKHVFIITFTCGYLAALVFSNFAHSGRFHMPIIPMLMLFAAYGISLANNSAKYKRWFNYVLIAEVFVCVAWSWFKLKGRGMI